MCGTQRLGAHLSLDRILSPALDASIGVFVQFTKILDHVKFFRGNHAGSSLTHLLAVVLEPRRQQLEGVCVELVLVGLEVSELGKCLSTRVQTTHKRSVVFVHELVAPVVASLGKLFATVVVFAHKRLFSGVRSLVCTQVATLGEPLATARNVALVGLVAGVGPFVDVEMCLLVEALVTARKVALVFQIRAPFLFAHSSIHQSHWRQKRRDFVAVGVQFLTLGNLLLVQLLGLDDEHERVYHRVPNGQQMRGGGHRALLLRWYRLGDIRFLFS